MHVEPYLIFNGCCEEAAAFYKTAIGAEIETMMRYKDRPDANTSAPPEKIMHASLKIGATRLLMSDGMCTGQTNFQGCSLTLTASGVSEAERLFKALAEDGQIRQPMTETFFTPAFGMVADRFGVSWIVLAAAAA